MKVFIIAFLMLFMGFAFADIALNRCPVSGEVFAENVVMQGGVGECNVSSPIVLIGANTEFECSNNSFTQTANTHKPIFQLNATNATLKNCKFLNQTAPIISLEGSDSVLIEKNIFENITLSGNNIIKRNSYQKLTLTKNIFKSNIIPESSSLLTPTTTNSNSEFNIIFNLFEENTGPLIKSIGYFPGDVTIENNIFLKNTGNSGNLIDIMAEKKAEFSGNLIEDTVTDWEIEDIGYGKTGGIMIFGKESGITRYNAFKGEGNVTIYNKYSYTGNLPITTSDNCHINENNEVLKTGTESYTTLWGRMSIYHNDGYTLDTQVTNAGDGRDGSIEINLPETVINKYASIEQPAILGSNEVIVSSANEFTVGQEIMLIQYQGSLETLEIGNYEFKNVIGISSNTLELSEPLERNYFTDGTNRAQIVSVPNYLNASVTENGSIVSPEWNGKTGGLITFRVQEVLKVDGEISATGKGYLGGIQEFCKWGQNGMQGFSINGAGTCSKENNLGGGGGGIILYTSGPYWGFAGAGASHPTEGSRGYRRLDLTGTPGEIYGDSKLGFLPAGSGGGSGAEPTWYAAYFCGSSSCHYPSIVLDSISIEYGITANYCLESVCSRAGHAGSGGNGGGVIALFAGRIESNGNIISQGGNGEHATSTGSGGSNGGGGGGSGGSLLIVADEYQDNRHKTTVRGGLGGRTSGDAFGGGFAGSGRIYLDTIKCEPKIPDLDELTNTPPFALFKAVPISGVLPFLVELDGSESYDLDGEIVSYDWDFGDGKFGIGKNTKHEYLNEGIFNVTLTATDDGGLSSSITKQVIPYGKESLKELFVTSSNTNEPIQAKVTCTKNLTANIEIWKTDGSGAQIQKIAEKTVLCNDSDFIDIGEVTTQGIYLVKANLIIAEDKCSRCEIKKFITIGTNTNIGVPDNNPLIIIAILMTVLLMVRK